MFTSYVPSVHIFVDTSTKFKFSNMIHTIDGKSNKLFELLMLLLLHLPDPPHLLHVTEVTEVEGPLQLLLLVTSSSTTNIPCSL